MITRKAFLQEAVRRCTLIFEWRASYLLSFLDGSDEENARNDQIALYREAMELGIDPASGDGNRLKERIRERGKERSRGNHLKSKKGGDISSTTVSSPPLKRGA